jgi:hypothetical protein
MDTVRKLPAEERILKVPNLLERIQPASFRGPDKAAVALADLLRGVLTHPSIRTTEEAFELLKLLGLRLWDSSGASIRATQNKICVFPIRGPHAIFFNSSFLTAALLGVRNPAKCDRSIVRNTFGNWKRKESLG